MNLFQHRAQSAFPLPDEDNRDARLQDTLRQAYAVENVSPVLRQRVADMAAYHEQQSVMYKPRRSRLRFGFAWGGIVGLLCLVYLISANFGLYTIPSASMEPTLMGHDAGMLSSGAVFYKPRTGGWVQGNNWVYHEAVYDRVLVNKWVYRWSNPQFGDIVMFPAPKEADAQHKYKGIQVENVLVKRIIGLPGDTIEIIGGHLYRNGKELIESYLKETMKPYLEEQFHYATPKSGGALTLKPDEYWVMGDNRNDSNDSRYWGVLERSRIIGKITHIIAPSQPWRSLP